MDANQVFAEFPDKNLKSKLAIIWGLIFMVLLSLSAIWYVVVMGFPTGAEDRIPLSSETDDNGKFDFGTMRTVVYDGCLFIVLAKYGDGVSILHSPKCGNHGEVR